MLFMAFCGLGDIGACSRSPESWVGLVVTSPCWHSSVSHMGGSADDHSVFPREERLNSAQRPGIHHGVMLHADGGSLPAKDIMGNVHG